MAMYQRTYSKPSYTATTTVTQENPWEKPVAGLVDALIGGISKRWDVAEQQQKDMGVAQKLRDALLARDINSIANDPTTASFYPDYFNAQWKNDLALDLKRKEDASGAQANLLAQGVMPDGGGYVDMSNPELSFVRIPNMAENMGEANRIKSYGTELGSQQATRLMAPGTAAMVEAAKYGQAAKWEPGIERSKALARGAAELINKQNEATDTIIPWGHAKQKAIEDMGGDYYTVLQNGGMPAMPGGVAPQSAPPGNPLEGIVNALAGQKGKPQAAAPAGYQESAWTPSAPAPAAAPSSVPAVPGFSAPNLHQQASNMKAENEQIAGLIKDAPRLESEFSKEVLNNKSYQSAKLANLNYSTMLDAVMSGVPQADADILNAAAKIPDPGSINRESDIAMQQGYRDLAGRVEGLFVKLGTGGNLTDDDKIGLARAASMYVDQYNNAANNDIMNVRSRVNETNRRVGRQIINPNVVFSGMGLESGIDRYNKLEQEWVKKNKRQPKWKEGAASGEGPQNKPVQQLTDEELKRIAGM